MERDTRSLPCLEQQANRWHTFTCNQKQGHAGPHYDTATGTSWNHPHKCARGMRRLRNPPRSGEQCANGVFYSVKLPGIPGERRVATR